MTACTTCTSDVGYFPRSAECKRCNRVIRIARICTTCAYNVECENCKAVNGIVARITSPIYLPSACFYTDCIAKDRKPPCVNCVKIASEPLYKSVPLTAKAEESFRSAIDLVKSEETRTRLVAKLMELKNDLSATYVKEFSDNLNDKKRLAVCCEDAHESKRQKTPDSTE